MRSMKSFILIIILVGICSRLNASNITVYDGSLGTAPDVQGMSDFSSPETVITTTSSETRVDSTLGASFRGGYNKTLSQSLDRTLGYQMMLSFNIHSESHNPNKDASGLRIRMESDDIWGIRLDFWEDEIWDSASDGSHVNGVTYDTQQMVNYKIDVFNDSYTLFGNDIFIKTGDLYLYSTGSPIGNFIQIGDSTDMRQRIIHSHI